MKKIITALDNPKVNNELNKLKKFKVIGKDICYQEGIFEILENENPDILLLSEILPGELEIKNLILKIKEKNKNLEIIIFLQEENTELIKFLKLNEIYNIFYNNKVTIQEFINKLEEKENKIKIINQNENNLNNSIEVKNKNKILSVIGPSGSGKTLFTCALAKKLSENKKILVLDFDLLNKDINLVLKNNNKINIILGQDIMFNNENIDYIKIKHLIENYKNEYDVIIINTSSECYFKLNKKLIKLSDKNLFISGTNIIEIKKSKVLLDIYINEWGIDKEKINIIFNKYNNYSIDEKILENIFKKYQIIGKIKFCGNNKFLLNNKLINRIII